jgi:hypothetical protein
MDYSEGIPAEYRSLVVIPTMLSSEEYIEELIEGLEIRYLANREANLHYALLTDFLDADSATVPGDENLVALVKSRIEGLNEKYRTPEENTFFLFHRPRKWNPRERKWMGYERKRGKLSALNAFLRQRGSDQFSLIVGNHQELSNVKYVITLDSDTQLPRESVWKFVATMAHPLNHAIYNPAKKRVTEGYGIFQKQQPPCICVCRVIYRVSIHTHKYLLMYTRMYLEKVLTLEREFMILMFLNRHWRECFRRTAY